MATTDAISGTSNTATASNTNSALNKLDDDFQSFLKLLTIQLQNQDPTDPLDTNQLTDQITQFSQVEQQINTNKSLEKLLAASQSSAVNSAVSYIDRFVEYHGNQFYYRPGNTPIINYKLPTQATNVTISVTDDSGRVLYSKDVSEDGATAANTPYAIQWDGKDSNGTQMAAGKYKINVTATDADGKSITPVISVTDIVTEVAVENGTVQLTMGDIKIASDQVVTIKGVYAEVPGGNNGDDSTDGTDTENETDSTEETTS